MKSLSMYEKYIWNVSKLNFLVYKDSSKKAFFGSHIITRAETLSYSLENLQGEVILDQKLKT